MGIVCTTGFASGTARCRFWWRGRSRWFRRTGGCPRRQVDRTPGEPLQLVDRHPQRPAEPHDRQPFGPARVLPTAGQQVRGGPADAEDGGGFLDGQERRRTSGLGRRCGRGGITCRAPCRPTMGTELRGQSRRISPRHLGDVESTPDTPFDLPSDRLRDLPFGLPLALSTPNAAGVTRSCHRRPLRWVASFPCRQTRRPAIADQVLEQQPEHRAAPQKLRASRHGVRDRRSARPYRWLP